MRFEHARRLITWFRESPYPALVEVYVGWRLGLLFLFYLAIAILNLTGQLPGNRTVLDAHFLWDGAYFYNIARYGYQGSVHLYGNYIVLGFFPLFPLIAKGVSYLTLGHIQPAAIITNTVATFAFMVYLYKLVIKDFETDTAFRTVFFMLLFPTAYYLAVNYSEPVFMLTLTASIYYARRENWTAAGIWGLLCAASRHLGILLLPVLAWEYLRQRGWKLRNIREDAAALLLVPLGSFLYMAYLWGVFGDPLIFLQSHRTTFQHGFNAAFWKPIGRALRLIWQRPLMDAARSIVTLNLIILVLFVALFIYGLKRLPSTYSLLVILFLLGILMTDSPTFPLVSLDRYVLPLFPAFILLAEIARKRAYEYVYLAASGMLLGAQALIFSLGKSFIA